MAGVNRVTSDPVRGTRPANRRLLIKLAAAELFAKRGYANVGMGEVADAVGIGPSALYRHFRGKQDLLAAVVSEALDTIDSLLAVATPENVDTNLAAVAVENRGIGVLVRRESRHLPAETRRTVQIALQRIVGRFAELLGVRRPELGAAEADLLARCAVSVASSVSYHNLSLPEPGITRLLGDLITLVVNAPVVLPEPGPVETGRRGTLTPRSRREAILTEATRRFARDGFAGASMEDIGAGVGVAGPALYRHFPAKSDILIEAVHRGVAWLQMDLNRVFARATDAGDGLRRLLISYRDFVFDNPGIIHLTVSETIYLPEDERHRARAAQHSYIAEWVYLVGEVHSEWDPVAIRIRVQALLTVLNEIALAPELRGRNGIGAALLAIGAELLVVSEPREP
ncbi:TetR/AcrR family transcriptional regulator [Nocardia sp. NPDC050712]|uniref:TetR/AcrR family transcriptional regulator n=1 Tax=Nocardia sp. NPDC050712 TaxID=3155518 RepID=UPI00340F7BB0